MQLFGIRSFLVQKSMVLDGWMDGWMDGRMDGWLDGWVDGWMDGWMNGSAGLKHGPHLSCNLHKIRANSYSNLAFAPFSCIKVWSWMDGWTDR